MSVRVSNDPAEFAATLFPFLEKDPVLNTVLLSNVQDRATGLLTDPSLPVFVSVHAADGQVVGGCMRTPGRGIFLGGLTDALVPTVVDAFAAAAPEADVVEGTAAAARLFAEEWSSRFGKEYKQTRGTRLHKLERFVAQQADGSPRQAGKSDVPLCVQWADAFGVDVGSRSAWSVTRPRSSDRPGSVRSTHLQSTVGMAMPAH